MNQTNTLLGGLGEKNKLFLLSSSGASANTQHTILQERMVSTKSDKGAKRSALADSFLGQHGGTYLLRVKRYDTLSLTLCVVGVRMKG